MKSPIMPLICGVVTAAMTAAGLSHWWSIRQFITVMEGKASIPRVQLLAATPQSAPAATDKAPVSAAAPQNPSATVSTSPDPGQQQFFEKLVTRMESLQSQNRDLLDQLAETNRDLMKLEFRVDTHSESFRPLPLSEEQPFTHMDEDLGVLPPRAEPVLLPNFE